MRVTFISPHYFPSTGGVESVVRVQAEALAARGHEVKVLTTHLQWPRRRISAPDHEEAMGVCVWRLPAIVTPQILGQSVFPVASNLWAIKGLENFLTAWKSDVIHVHHLVPGVVRTVIALNEGSAQVVWQPHFHPRDPARVEWIRGGPDRYAFRSAARVGSFITINPLEKELIENQYAIRIRAHLVPNATSFSGQCKAADSRSVSSQMRILTVGRVDDRRKGHEFLLDALACVGLETNWTLAVVGRGDPRRLLSYAKKKGVAGRMTLAGEASDQQLHEWYAWADVFAMPSQYEAFGLPFLEAMTCGVPVIGTRVGGVPWVVEGSGLLVEYGDVRALAGALRSVLENPYLRKELRIAGIREARRFGVTQMIDSLEEVYGGS